MKNNKVLWLSMMAPYDGVGHASGKIQNYYLKKLNLLGRFNIKLLTLCKDEEVSRLDLSNYGIDNRVFVRRRSGILGTIRRGYSWVSKFNVFNQYGGLTPHDIQAGMKDMLNDLSKELYVPDIIIFEWTEILFMLPYVSKLYPNAKYVAIEEDVSYLGLQRHMDYTKNKLLKFVFRTKYNKVKKLELKYLNECSLIILNNRKDKDLVLSSGFNGNVWVWSPFFQSYLNKPRLKSENKNIVFYGAMFREENWKSALWFVENVLEKISDKEVKFVIVGSSPNKKLANLQNPRVIIKGFVEDISEELMNSLCLVAPLVLGAGVKIKIIEALSCGIPILTNEIGIEGIPAKKDKSYFFCKTPEDYVQVINRLLNKDIDLDALEISARMVVTENFDFEKDVDIFAEKLVEISEVN